MQPHPKEAARIDALSPREVYLEFFSYSLEAQHQIENGHEPDEDATCFMRSALIERATADERQRVE